MKKKWRKPELEKIVADKGASEGVLAGCKDFGPGPNISDSCLYEPFTQHPCQHYESS